jgi:hypothetical protein
MLKVGKSHGDRGLIRPGDWLTPGIGEKINATKNLRRVVEIREGKRSWQLRTPDNGKLEKGKVSATDKLRLVVAG